jgi:opacity protein-like surface antigen
MRTVRQIVLIGTLVFVSLSLALPARAQDQTPIKARPLRLGVGYDFSSTSSGGLSQNYPEGLNVQFDRTMWKVSNKLSVGIGAEFRYAYYSQTQNITGVTSTGSTGVTTGTTSIDSADTLTSYLGGLRLEYKGCPKIRPYAKVEAGLAHWSFTSSYSDFSSSDSENAFTFLAGGGVSTRIRPHLDVFVGFDYQYSNFNSSANTLGVEGGVCFCPFCWLKGS